MRSAFRSRRSRFSSVTAETSASQRIAENLLQRTTAIRVPRVRRFRSYGKANAPIEDVSRDFSNGRKIDPLGLSLLDLLGDAVSLRHRSCTIRCFFERRTGHRGDIAVVVVVVVVLSSVLRNESLERVLDF